MSNFPTKANPNGKLQAVPADTVATLSLNAAEVGVMFGALTAFKRQLWSGQQNFPLDLDLVAGDLLRTLAPVHSELLEMQAQAQAEAQKKESAGENPPLDPPLVAPHEVDPLASEGIG